MGSWSTRHFCQIGIYKEKGQRCDGCDDPTERCDDWIRTPNNIPTEHQYRKSQTTEISPINGNSRCEIGNGRQIVLLRKTNPEDWRGKTKNLKTEPWQWRDWISRIQEDSMEDRGSNILGCDAKRNGSIHSKLSDMPEGKKVSQDWFRRGGQKTQKYMKTNINWSHHKIIKDQRKGFNTCHPRSIIRNDIFENSQGERISRRSLARL